MPAPSLAMPFVSSQTAKPGLSPAATARQQELVPPPYEAKANKREVRIKRVTVFITLRSIKNLTRIKTSGTDADCENRAATHAAFAFHESSGFRGVYGFSSRDLSLLAQNERTASPLWVKSRPDQQPLNVQSLPQRSHERTFGRAPPLRRFVQILLKKSQFAGRRIFREKTKREAIADSYSLPRIAEVASELA